jgi:hypothetical protein
VTNRQTSEFTAVPTKLSTAIPLATTPSLSDLFDPVDVTAAFYSVNFSLVVPNSIM